MNISTIRLAVALGIAISFASPTRAQSTLGGAKNQQNKIGGAAKPAPSVGGAVVHTPPPPKPAPVVSAVKPASPGVVAPGMTAGSALGQPANPRPNPQAISPKPAGAVVTSNLKCANGACTSKGPKP